MAAPEGGGRVAEVTVGAVDYVLAGGVPVMRVFGATPAGQRCLAHLHGARPRLYIPLPGGLCAERDASGIQEFLSTLHNRLDEALEPQWAGGREAAGPSRSQRPSRVEDCRLVRARSFYGFSSERPFVAIVLKRPGDKRRAAAALERRGGLGGGAWLMGDRLQPYEAHLPFLLQVKQDFNLHGMGLMRLSRGRFRGPLPALPHKLEWRSSGDEWELEFEPDDPQLWLRGNTPWEWRPESGEAPPLERESTCELELDAEVEYILNRHDIDYTPLEDLRGAADKKMVPSLAPVWAEEAQRRRAAGLGDIPASPPEPNRSPQALAEDRSRQLRQRLALLQENEPPLPAQMDEDYGRVRLSENPGTPPLSLTPANRDSGVGLTLDEARTQSQLLCSSRRERGVSAAVSEGSDPVWDEAAITDAERVEAEWLQRQLHAKELQDWWEENRDCLGEGGGELAEPGTGPASQKQSQILSQLTQRANTQGVTNDLVEELQCHMAEALTQREWDDIEAAKVESGEKLPGTESKQRRQCNELGPEQDSPGGTGEEGIFSQVDPTPDVQEDVRKLLSTGGGSQRKWGASSGGERLTPPGDRAYTQPFYGDPRDASHRGRLVNLKGQGAGTSHPVRRCLEDIGPEMRRLLFCRDERASGGLELPVGGRPVSGVRSREAVGSEARDDSAFEGEAELAPPQKQLRREIPSPSVRFSGGGKNDGNDSARGMQRRATVSVLSSPRSVPRKSGVSSAKRSLSSEKGFRVQPLSSDKLPPFSVLAVEIQATSSRGLLPNPEENRVALIALALADGRSSSDAPSYRYRTLAYAPTDSDAQKFRACLPSSQLLILRTEQELFKKFVESVHEVDPDVILGFETQGGSLGFLERRYRCIATAGAGRPQLMHLLSRTPGTRHGTEDFEDAYDKLHASGLKCGGRAVLNLWRILKTEVKLSDYSFENCVKNVLNLRVPRFEPRTKQEWLEGSSSWRCFRDVQQRATLSLRLAESIDLVGRTSEFARVFGIDFYSVITRGSQYRVESLLARIAHTQNYLLVSPSVDQRKQQPAMESIPLVMEPRSGFYTSPVVVLDFQSLYPSMIIAYNICYSTLLGRFGRDGSWPERLGALPDTPERVPLSGHLDPSGLVYAPNGAVFVPKSARHGVLPRMLTEILSTRQMIKRAMKEVPPSKKSLVRLLNSRQLGLKLLANVTYGYTSAGFSGRMPCPEIADAIVQSGRDTLEATKRFIESPENRARWGGEVVYGDTDSLFVHLPGKTREAAHRIGQEMADAVTAVNPSPVRLQMEKVYLPCFLLAKKRYVGFSYEDPQQSRAKFDAKGIETVRRDSCRAVQKVLEKSLRMLFTTKDVSAVKAYVVRQWEKVLLNRVNLKDFVFCKEVREGTYAVRPCAAVVAARAKRADPMAEAKYAERIAYVVVHAGPEAKLAQHMVISPEDLVIGGSRRIHGEYYITKQIIPALERCYSLLTCEGAPVDVREWFRQMQRPKLPSTKRPALDRNSAHPVLFCEGAVRLQSHRDGLPLATDKTLDEYFPSRSCTVCNESLPLQEKSTVCGQCQSDPQSSGFHLASQAARLEREAQRLAQLCLRCGGGQDPGAPASSGGTSFGRVPCSATDCSRFYARHKVDAELQAAAALLDEDWL